MLQSLHFVFGVIVGSDLCNFEYNIVLGLVSGVNIGRFRLGSNGRFVNLMLSLTLACW